jgi:heme exporter protein A
MITTLSIAGLALSRGDRPLFERFNLSVSAGQAIALTGANGAGKTSLLRAIAGFIRPDAGEIVFSGADGALDPDEARAGGLHLIGHLDGLKSGRTAFEELRFQAQWTGAEDAAIETACDQLDLGRLRNLEVRKLSAGQRRRVALARLLASPRPLWLLDEPLTPLDVAWRARFGEIMASHVACGGMIIAAVHDPLPIPARPFELGAVEVTA